MTALADASCDEIFLRARRGERPAFADLITQHRAMVFSIAVNYLRDEGTAEEVAQEVFLELYRSLATLESAAHAVHWLRRVTVNRCIDVARRRKRHAQSPLEDAPEPAVEPDGRDPMLRERLRRLVAGLPEAARAVVVLRFQEDLDPTDIARVLEMPLNTVKSHLQRSLAVLRSKVAGVAQRQL